MTSLIAHCFMTLPDSVVSHSVIQRSRKKQISLEGKKGTESILPQDNITHT